MTAVVDFGARHITAELMDDVALPQTLHEQALAALARINRLSLSAEHLWPLLVDRSRRYGALRVLDIASGGGDVPLRVAEWAAQRAVPLLLDGCDISAGAMRYAARRARNRAPSVRFFEHDVMSAGVPTGYDVITCSLFLHHLSDAAALELLGQMKRAAPCVIVQDLERSRVAWHVAKWGSRVLSRSKVVHYDAPASVAAAFSVAEARRLAARAGMSNARIRRVWPWRWVLQWESCDAAA